MAQFYAKYSLCIHLNTPAPKTAKAARRSLLPLNIICPSRLEKEGGGVRRLLGWTCSSSSHVSFLFSSFIARIDAPIRQMVTQTKCAMPDTASLEARIADAVKDAARAGIAETTLNIESNWRKPPKNGWTGKNGVWRTSTNPLATSRWSVGKESRAPWRWSTLPIILSLPLCPTFRGCPPRWSGLLLLSRRIPHRAWRSGILW